MTYRFSQRIEKTPKSFIREILKATSNPDMISFAGGLPNPISFPDEAINAATNKVLKTDGKSVLQYSTTQGYLPLREYIAQRYYDKNGISVSPDEILITNGSQQALDLIGKIFLDKDDDMIIERPGYLGAIQAFSIFEPNFIEVPVGKEGMDIDVLKSALLKDNAKLIYAVPNFQNPSGITYSKENREAVARLINKTNTVLIEDNPYGELRFKGKNQPSFKTYLGDQAILLGSFSKIVSPAMRMGWVCATGAIMDKLIIAKQASDLHSNYFSQRVLCQYLLDNDLDYHVEKIKDLYKRQCDCMIKCIKNDFPSDITITQPQGGMFLWVTLPKKVSALKLFDRASKQNVAFVPGNPFYANRPENNTLRLNYTNSSIADIKKGIAVLAGLLKD
jgi:2-aminoadipate transaminase